MLGYGRLFGSENWIRGTEINSYKNGWSQYWNLAQFQVNHGMNLKSAVQFQVDWCINLDPV